MLRNLEEYGQEEVDELEELISTGATTAETVEQLEIEVQTLKGLETMALGVLRSGQDTKWTQLDRILDDDLMVDADGTAAATGAISGTEYLPGWLELPDDSNQWWTCPLNRSIGGETVDDWLREGRQLYMSDGQTIGRIVGRVVGVHMGQEAQS